MSYNLNNTLRLWAAIGVVWATGLVTSSARAEPSQLKMAITAYEGFEYEDANRLLTELIADKTTERSTRAQAWLYMGLVHFTVGDRKQAVDDFTNALKLQDAIRPPADTSPKILRAFEQARKKLGPGHPPKETDPKNNDVAGHASGSPGQPPIAKIASPARHGRLWTWISAGVGAAALLGGGVSGILASQSRQEFDDAVWASEAADHRSAVESRSLTANVLFGVGSAALLAAVILFFVEDDAAEPTESTTFLLAPGRLKWTTTFRF